MKRKPAAPRKQQGRSSPLEDVVLVVLKNLEVPDLIAQPPAIKLAEKCKYTPDFGYKFPGCWQGFIEVKGPFEKGGAESRVKFKWASSILPNNPFVWMKQQRPSKRRKANGELVKKAPWLIEVWKAGYKLKTCKSIQEALGLPELPPPS